jgi:Tol biopolymer transport system component
MMRLQIATEQSSDPLTFALSPDGRSIVFHAVIGGGSQLVLRRLNSDEDRVLTTAEAPSFPFWSPDSLSVAFFADGLLKRIDVASGFVRTIAPAPNPRPGSWSRNGTILFGASTGPIYKVPGEGGAVEQVTTLTPGQSSHRFAQFLPDGRRFLYLALGEANVKGIYLASLDSKVATRVLDGEPPFSFLAPDYVLVAGQGALWAQRLDLESGKTRGDLLPVAQSVFVHSDVNGFAALSSSSANSLAYRAAAETRQLVWIDREGRQTGVLGPPDQFQTSVSSFSPDDRTVAFRRSVNGNTDVWLMDISRGALRRLTFDPSIEDNAVFSPDGSRFAYASDPKSTLWDMYERRTDGTGAETLIVASPKNENPVK